MSNSSRIYVNPRPILTINVSGTKNLGRCYNSTTYKITSLRPLDYAAIKSLRNAGFLGYGQTYSCYYLSNEGKKVEILDPVDHKIRLEPTGFDTIECSEVDNVSNKVIRVPSINPYSGKPDLPIQSPYYIYVCEDVIDSSD